MIASSMLFLGTVSLLAAAAASLGEAGLRRLGAPTRFAWLGALALGPALLSARSAGLLVGRAPAPPPAWAPVVELPALTVAAGGSGPGMEEALGLLWLLSALALGMTVVRTHRTLLRERAGWESTRVMGQDVRVSADRGPAVAGLWNPWIVLPRWVLSLPEAELRMVLLHEEEHIRARDTRLLAGALALVALSAWNPVSWFQLRRLRAAMEVDCDRRVLRAVPDRATYGASLLTVAARASGPSLGLAAFTERSLNLKRRILAMTAKTTRGTAVGGGVLVVVGLVVGVQACGVESPMGVSPTAGFQAVELPAPDSSSATFTPFTQAPELLNREEVVAALEANYPPLLKDAGVGGRANVWMFIDETGTVTDVRIDESSGHPALDDAALRVAGRYRFKPALNKDVPVSAWVSFPITFALTSTQEGTVRFRAATADPTQPVPTPPRSELEKAPTFTPFTVAPSILNRDEVVAAMEKAYPTELRDAGVGGTARVYFFIDEEGSVARVLLDRSSGEAALDEAALRVAGVYRFAPALNKSEKVPVWVSFPITFMVK